ncbi:MAG: hypothetical protein AAFZ05_14420 [Pseudomonadota bacterium]
MRVSMIGRGWPVITIVRGQAVVLKAELTGAVGGGDYIRRARSGTSLE